MNSIAHAAGIAAARSPPTASALARHKIGRSRFPPAVTLYRIASATIAGQSGGTGREAVSAASTSRRRDSRYSLNEEFTGKGKGQKAKVKRQRYAVLTFDF